MKLPPYINKKNSLLWVTAYVALAISIFSFTVTANAVEVGIMEATANLFADLFSRPAKWIFFLGSALFSWTLQLTVFEFSEIANTGAVRDMWSVVRDVVNLFIVAGFLITAFNIIIGKKLFGFEKKTIFYLLGSALVVNFSAFIVLAILDISHALILSVYNILGSEAVSPGKGIFNVFGVIEQQSVSVAIYRFISVGFLLIASLFSFFGFAILTVLLLKRLFIALFLVLTSPSVIILYILKDSKLFLSGYYEKWKNALFTVVTQPIIMLLGLYGLFQVFSIMEQSAKERMVGEEFISGLALALIAFASLIIGLVLLIKFIVDTSGGIPLRDTGRKVIDYWNERRYKKVDEFGRKVKRDKDEVDKETRKQIRAGVWGLIDTKDQSKRRKKTVEQREKQQENVEEAKKGKKHFEEWKQETEAGRQIEYEKAEGSKEAKRRKLFVRYEKREKEAEEARRAGYEIRRQQQRRQNDDQEPPQDGNQEPPQDGNQEPPQDGNQEPPQDGEKPPQQQQQQPQQQQPQQQQPQQQQQQPQQQQQQPQQQQHRQQQQQQQVQEPDSRTSQERLKQMMDNPGSLQKEAGEVTLDEIYEAKHRNVPFMKQLIHIKREKRAKSGGSY